MSLSVYMKSLELQARPADPKNTSSAISKVGAKAARLVEEERKE